MSRKTTEKKGDETTRSEAEESVGLRLAKYERVLRLFNLKGAVLLGGVTIYAAVSLGESLTYLSSILGAIFLTLVGLSAAFLARSRGLIEWQADLLKRYLERKENNGGPEAVLKLGDRMGDVPGKLKIKIISAEWPTGERRARISALVAMLIAGLVLLVWVWLPVIQPAIFQEQCDEGRDTEQRPSPTENPEPQGDQGGFVRKLRNYKELAF